jgi:hypothetical protein
LHSKRVQEARDLTIIDHKTIKYINELVEYIY